MRQPLWIINSSLLILFAIGQIIFFLMYVPVVRRFSLQTETVVLSSKKNAITVDIKNIYEQNDLFGTYVAPLAVAAKSTDQTIPAIPEVPAYVSFSLPVEQEKIFINPLPVLLRGIMYNYDRPDLSVAMVQFQDSKEEFNYKIGQLISDAQILKIYPNRVIIIRSNGQQETLYLREQEVSKDSQMNLAKIGSDITIHHKGNSYFIPVLQLIEKIKSLGQCIDLLGLTTVYQKGKSIGCRVTKVTQDSLASKLGFKKDDIISKVQDIPITDIASRVLAYDQVLQKGIGDTIEVVVERGSSSVTLQYVLVKDMDPLTNFNESEQSNEVKAKEKSEAKLDTSHISESALEAQRKKILEQKVKLAPTVYQIEKEERRKILEARKQESLVNRRPLSENTTREAKKNIHNVIAKT